MIEPSESPAQQPEAELVVAVAGSKSSYEQSGCSSLSEAILDQLCFVLLALSSYRNAKRKTCPHQDRD